MFNLNDISDRVRFAEVNKTKKYYADLIQFVKSHTITMEEAVKIVDGGRGPPPDYLSVLILINFTGFPATTA